MHHSDVSPWAIRGLYLFAFVLVFSPMMDLMSTVWPMRPMELPWRYGFLGLMAGYLHTPILGLILAMAVAHWSENGGVLRMLGSAMLFAAGLLVLVMALFMLDVVEMRAIREPEMQSAVLVGGLLQQVKYGTALLVLGALGIGSIRTGRSHARQGGRGRAPGIVSTAT